MSGLVSCVMRGQEEARLWRASHLVSCVMKDAELEKRYNCLCRASYPAQRERPLDLHVFFSHRRETVQAIAG